MRDQTWAKPRSAAARVAQTTQGLPLVQIQNLETTWGLDCRDTPYAAAD